MSGKNFTDFTMFPFVSSHICRKNVNFGYKEAFLISKTSFIRISVQIQSGKHLSDFKRLNSVFWLYTSHQKFSNFVKVDLQHSPNNAPRNLGECCTTQENVERFFKYTRAKRLGLAKFFLIQIFSLQYFHMKLFLCDRQRLNIDGTGRRFCFKFSSEPQNTISSDGTKFSKNFFAQNPSLLRCY